MHVEAVHEMIASNRTFWSSAMPLRWAWCRIDQNRAGCSPSFLVSKAMLIMILSAVEKFSPKVEGKGISPTGTMRAAANSYTDFLVGQLRHLET